MKESGIGRENGVEAFEACESDPESVVWYGSYLVYMVARAA